MLKLKIAIQFSMLVFCSGFALAQEGGKGEFVGKMVIEDYDPSEAMRFILKEDLEYKDPRGLRWIARAGLVFDGASIPRALWSAVGSPYTGRYRRAAVIHDFYCTNLYRPWKSVHKMFYNAMITDGVDPIKAKIMYYAVYRFGPRWETREISTCPPNLACNNPGYIQGILSRPKLSDSNSGLYFKELNDFEELIKRDNPDLEQIERLALDAKTPLNYESQDVKITDDWSEKVARDKDPEYKPESRTGPLHRQAPTNHP